jgi:hypothetical protein
MIQSPDTATPATACSEPALIIERFAGKLNIDNTQHLVERQAFRLVSKFGLAFETVAALAWGIAR